MGGLLPDARGTLHVAGLHVRSKPGRPQRLSEALDTSPGVQLYLYYADTYGLDYETEELDDVRLPGYDGSLDLLHAGPA